MSHAFVLVSYSKKADAIQRPQYPLISFSNGGKNVPLASPSVCSTSDYALGVMLQSQASQLTRSRGRVLTNISRCPRAEGRRVNNQLLVTNAKMPISKFHRVGYSGVLVIAASTFSHTGGYSWHVWLGNRE